MIFFNHRKTRFSLLTVIAIVLFSSHASLAAEASISWLPNSETNLAGYKIHFGITSGNYIYEKDVRLPQVIKGRVQASIGNLSEGKTYYFVATAYNTDGVESGNSAEVFYSVPTTDPVVDSDNDGLTDYDEIHVYGTDPEDSDTDNDGFTDGYEIEYGFDPDDPDSRPLQNEVIIDNGDAGTASDTSWNISGGENPYGSNSLYSKGVEDFYAFEASVNGSYQVYLWWTEWASRLTDVPVEIYDGDILIDVIKVNQQINGGKWNVLGTYEFSGKASVVIVSEGDGSTSADAVRLVPVPSSIDEVIIDNGDAGTASDASWNISGGENPFGSNSLYSKTVGEIYAFEASVNGSYQVSLWWTEWPSRLTDVPVKIYDGDTLIDVIKVNQQINGGKWNVLGIYEFSGKASVVIVSEGDGSTSADAVRLVPSSINDEVILDNGDEVIIDNGDAGTASDANWNLSGGDNPFGSNSLYSKTVGEIYAFEASVNGSYQVSLWWTEWPSRLTDVPVEIYDGDTLIDVIKVNQQINGGKWNVLGIYEFSGKASVVIVSEGDGSTSADAVRLVPSSIDEIMIYNGDTGTASDGGSTSADAVGFVPSSIDEVIIDNGDAGAVSDGNWLLSGGGNPYSSNSLYSKGVGDTYAFEASVNGSYQISLWWTEWSSRLTDVPVEIYDGDMLIDIIKVNQQINGGKWNVLGTYEFSGKASVVIVSEGDGSTSADAVRLVPSSIDEVIIDNGDAGTASDGSWNFSRSENPYGSNSLYSKDVGDTYAFEASVNGSYQVSLWWTEWSSRLTDVPVEIYDGDMLIDIIKVNQQINGGKWNVLGTYEFSGKASVVIVSEGDGNTSADAIRLVPST